MKLYDCAASSLDIENHILEHTIGYKTVEIAKSVNDGELPNIYEIEITVTQVEPKL